MKWLILSLVILDALSLSAHASTSQLSKQRNRVILTEPGRARLVFTQASDGQPDGRQSQEEVDQALTDEIFKLLWSESDSLNLINVNIETRGGKVTLRGQVETVDESRLIERLATDVAGRGNVANQLTVPQR